MMSKVQFWSLVVLVISLTIGLGAVVVYLEMSRTRSTVNIPALCKMYTHMFPEPCPMLAPPPPIFGPTPEPVPVN